MGADFNRSQQRTREINFEKITPHKREIDFPDEGLAVFEQLNFLLTNYEPWRVSFGQNK